MLFSCKHDRQSTGYHRARLACFLQQALQALGCMEHRGACSADDDSGDGAGIMMEVPWKLLQKEVPQLKEGGTHG